MSESRPSVSVVAGARNAIASGFIIAHQRRIDCARKERRNCQVHKLPWVVIVLDDRAHHIGTIETIAAAAVVILAVEVELERLSAFEA